MVKSLTLKNFMVFQDADFEFGGLNVIVGENGTGKSSLLKLVYCLLWSSWRGAPGPDGRAVAAIDLERIAQDKLQGVFHPEELADLVTRRPARNGCQASLRFADSRADLAAYVWLGEDGQSQLFGLGESWAEPKTPSEWAPTRPVFLPAQELLSIYPGLVSLHEGRYLELDETWPDTCLLLGDPLVRGRREELAKHLIEPISRALGGATVVNDHGRFYLDLPNGGGRFEMHMVAEGWRKLATLMRLIGTGALLDEGYLLWDEPEANLNPAQITLVARTILDLCVSGVQVWLATHSLFLMREIDLLLGEPEFAELGRRFFGLHRDGLSVTVQQGDTVDDIGPITVLDEAVRQADRYLARD